MSVAIASIKIPSIVSGRENLIITSGDNVSLGIIKRFERGSF